MSIKPILFSTPMVQAILEGRKAQTRRVFNPQPPTDASFIDLYDKMVVTAIDHHGNEYPKDVEGLYSTFEHDGLPQFPVFKAAYMPGDILWVRETWRMGDFSFIDGDWSASVQYKDGAIGARLHNLTEDERLGWRPSIHMPKAAARIFLRVTDVRAERLNEISEEDAIREGCARGDRYAGERSTPAQTAKQSFMWLWNMLNDKRGYSWCSNAWVWVYTFESCEKPKGWCAK